MYWRKYPFLLTVSLLPHLQYYQRYKSMIFQNVGKIKLVLWQPGYYNLLTEKWYKNGCPRFWSAHFLENVLLLSISRNSLQAPFLDNILSRSFTSSDSIILVEYLIKWKRCFEIFLIEYCAGDIWNKNITGKY